MKKGIMLAAVLFLFINVHDAGAANLENSMSFKVTIIENGIEYEWEYENPDDYEYEHGNTVEKGEQAKREVRGMFRYLNISPTAKVERMVERLKKDDHEHLERLDVRWINKNEKLYTWVWNKDDKH